MVSIELKIEDVWVFGIKRIFRRGRNWFPLDSSNLSWAPDCISPRWINISLLTITSKTSEALLRCQSYRFIAKWIALLNRWLSCKVDSCGVWFNFEWMSKQWNQISLTCVRRQQKLFWFFQLHTIVKLFFNTNYFQNQARIPTSTRTRHQVMCVDDHKPLFRQTCETNSETFRAYERGFKRYIVPGPVGRTTGARDDESTYAKFFCNESQT